MALSASPVPSQILECVGTGRAPTAHDVLDVAERIWLDGAHDRSAFAWTKMASDSEERLTAIRAARMALAGST